eukprot:TRINITY_DN28229_c0_g3_i1.p1 TRINITY_DN28229_c0_g3~~TRINITY_DN28229_c0_g3_i1.p1  ORF type:complete len:379 (-),score=40.88 TRINITY_DN28229_c0_g3_i1:114-1157(-)
MVKVIELDEDGHMYSVDNRRLALFRLLEIHGFTRVVKVRVLARSELHKQEWKKKFSTTSQGLCITVSGPEGWKIGVTASETTYPLTAIPNISAPKTDLVGLDSDEEDAATTSSQSKKRKIIVDNTRCTRAQADHGQPLAIGAERIVYKACYTDGDRVGDLCVKKVFKTGSVYEDSFFANDLEVVAKANDIIDAFSCAQLGAQLKKALHVNRPSVWTHMSERDPHKSLIEPFIEGVYKNFNSNTGWSDSGHEIAQAVSHFSYHWSSGTLVLCDLQGAEYEEDVVFTDPAICSNVAKKYGPTDLGIKGINSVMTRHQCNRYCHPSWSKVPQAAMSGETYPANKGTTFMI